MYGRASFELLRKKVILMSIPNFHQTPNVTMNHFHAILYYLLFIPYFSYNKPVNSS